MINSRFRFSPLFLLRSIALVLALCVADDSHVRNAHLMYIIKNYLMHHIYCINSRFRRLRSHTRKDTRTSQTCTRNVLLLFIYILMRAIMKSAPDDASTIRLVCTHNHQYHHMCWFACVRCLCVCAECVCMCSCRFLHKLAPNALARLHAI